MHYPENLSLSLSLSPLVSPEGISDREASSRHSVLDFEEIGRSLVSNRLKFNKYQSERGFSAIFYTITATVSYISGITVDY